jgi:hypothetical protein
MAAVLAIASSASAQTSRLYFAVAEQGGRSYVSGATGHLSPASNPTLYLAPSEQEVAYPDANSYSQGALHLGLTVAVNGGGAGDETMSALGLDISGSEASAGSATLTATDFDYNNTPALTGATNAPWSGTNVAGVTGAIGASGNLVTDARAVAVPDSSASPLFNGFTVGGPFNAGTLELQASGLSSGAGLGEVSYGLKFAVGTLKITRVFDPNGVAGTAPESIGFGAAGDSNNGSSVGSSVGADDATVIVRKKGDFGVVDPNTGVLDPTADGQVTPLEQNAWIASIGTADGTLDNYLGDFGVVDPNTGVLTAVPDGQVTPLEQNAWIASIGT